MEAIAAQPPAPYRWKILGLTVGGQASTAALFQGLPSIGPVMASSYGLTLGQVGLALGAVGFGMTLTLLPWGLAADRFGERRVIPLGRAIAISTSIAASRIGLADRGRIAEGAFADIVIFDPAKVHDAATYTEPHQLAEGMTHILVNGVLVRENGTPTSELPGRVLSPERR